MKNDGIDWNSKYKCAIMLRNSFVSQLAIAVPVLLKRIALEWNCTSQILTVDNRLPSLH
ncbi:MAG: hypothetical protein RBJ76_15795 [Stenomitos frigidus ULC029]